MSEDKAPIPQKGDHVGGDKITVGDISNATGVAIGRGASASVMINSMPEGEDEAKQELEQLIAELNELLKETPAEQRQLGEQIAKETELLVSAASTERPNPTVIAALGEALKQTGRKLGDNLPEIVDVTTKIAMAVAAIAGVV